MSSDSQPSSSQPNSSTLLDDPSIPPKDGRCIINELPTELLSHIFLLGYVNERIEKIMNDGDARFERMMKRTLGTRVLGIGGEVPMDVTEIPKDDGDSEYEDVQSEESEESEESAGNPYSFLQDNEWELLITRVCRRWRDVAIEVPQLWSTLSFTEESNLKKAETYLERSKGAPIAVSIDYRDDDSSKAWNHETESAEYAHHMEGLMIRFRLICDMVRPHMSHVDTLEVEVTLWKYMAHTLHFLAQIPEAPMLDVLRLYHYDADDDDHDVGLQSIIPLRDRQPQPVLFHNNAPRLTQVALWGVHLNWTESTFLSGLHYLELAYHEVDLRPTFKDFARILQDSPNLEILTISESGPQGGPVDWLASISDGAEAATGVELSTDIQLPSVKEFVLAYVECGFGLDLLDRLVFTSLDTFTLDVEDDDFSALISALAKPHRVTGKPLLAGLESLHLAGVGECRKSAVAEAMGVLQNLKALHLNFNFVSRFWYEALFPGDTLVMPATHGITAPRLDTLYSSGLEGEELSVLLKARKAAGVPLAKLYMNRDDDLEEEDEEWFRSTESGLKVFDFFENSDEEEVTDSEGSLIEMDMDDEDVWDDEWDDDEDDDDDDDDDEDDEDEDEDGMHPETHWLDIA